MNRFTLYGDLIFETIKVIEEEPQYLKKHFDRLMFGAKLLKFETEEFNFNIFDFEINRAIKKYREDHITASHFLRLRFVMHRKSVGNYLPDSNEIGYFIEIFPFETKTAGYPVKTGVYRFQSKAPGPFSNIKSGNSILSVMASIWARENNLADALIINTNNHIIESATSNLFWFKKGNWYTPPLKDGCVAGIMRSVFMENNEVIEKSCLLTDLITAEKRKLSNTIHELRDFIIWEKDLVNDFPIHTVE